MTPSRTRIKFCGLTRERDVADAVAAGADALGFVLWPGSKRCVDEARLAALAAQVPAFVTRVGLFVDASPEFVQRASRHLDLLQFHGDETPSFCAQFGRPWIKALRMRDDLDLHAAAAAYDGAQALLLDAYRPGVPGGTGETFDWSRIPASLAKPVILAGGLTPDNVAGAIERVRPFAVDVSGGVEAEPGVKDPGQLSAFAAAVAEADRKRPA
ncbi:phosphoribosylanthranilate isomerase [Halomonas sp. MCCC 1A17488]|uniref:N-(5'-phosphoribosyl)anthranilate isomerase n=1 Tax=Billgrantia sulfidoxydans TaxID=2733484 RepID=A0ABX7W6T9_9GAMM|nr:MULTISPECIES: phosphoribosylanthranilate isomerase [Halomonas]MCE8014738.1 phosphoribosylanthranilate isomerase [Halomonas sp. MCCC 1A17488]MCG3238071.1 phosphoribosylanthranilate isomerase [Halomonas sp. MCCC 1A17488]QPP48153.1 phosphoribosylanthranilate isomerase [Halomonas sp. SS10-MC5]QTP55455.1 phosphoribosylanthranilate isomerase [Halomonas sulfidoxydans]